MWLRPSPHRKHQQMEIDLTKEEWKERLAAADNAVVLDVRTPQEWADGVQPKARMLNVMDRTKFVEVTATLDKNKTYFVYCRSGARSANACQYLQAMGFEKVHNLLGGMLEWDGEVVPMNSEY